jgi:ComF family protein
VFNIVLNFLFPPQCLICNARVPATGTLCLDCWQNVKFIADPYCACCGQPFDYSIGKDALCGECLRERPVYGRARAVFRYNEYSRALILKLKYADQTHLSAVYGTWLANYGKDVVGVSDILIPVPLHYWRFIGRRYNQSALLANALKKRCGLPVLPDGLKRIRYTKPQPGLTRKQRRENVKGAFVVHPRHAASIKGKTILLIDDVMTTAATISQCAQALLDAGAMQINVLTLARKS